MYYQAPYLWYNSTSTTIGEPVKYHEEVLSLQPMIPPKRFDIFPLTGGCSEGLDAFIFFFIHCRIQCRHLLLVLLIVTLYLVPDLSFFVLFSLLSLELCRCPSDLFLSSRPRTGLATTYITGYRYVILLID